MKLFNKYQSRAFQFSAELLARLEQRGSLRDSELMDMAAANGLDYAGQVLDPLCRAGILECINKVYYLSKNFSAPKIPMGQVEREYLRIAVELPEAVLFLPEDIRAELRAACGETCDLDIIERYAPAGEPIPEHPGPEGFRTLLQAIHQRQLICYIYRTRDDKTYRESTTLPWKLEYSAYDRRWWIILYDPAADRMIKARLDNLKNIRLAGPAKVSETCIKQAMDRLLAPSPVVIEVQQTMGALERCFLTFENQMFEQTQQLGNGRFRLAFRYYRFDRNEILRRLLYLGPAVTLMEPMDLRAELARMLDKILEQ